MYDCLECAWYGFHYRRGHACAMMRTAIAAALAADPICERRCRVHTREPMQWTWFAKKDAPSQEKTKTKTGKVSHMSLEAGLRQKRPGLAGKTSAHILTRYKRSLPQRVSIGSMAKGGDSASPSVHLAGMGYRRNQITKSCAQVLAVNLFTNFLSTPARDRSGKKVVDKNGAF